MHGSQVSKTDCLVLDWALVAADEGRSSPVYDKSKSRDVKQFISQLKKMNRPTGDEELSSGISTLGGPKASRLHKLRRSPSLKSSSTPNESRS